MNIFVWFYISTAWPAAADCSFTSMNLGTPACLPPRDGLLAAGYDCAHNINYTYVATLLVATWLSAMLTGRIDA